VNILIQNAWAQDGGGGDPFLSFLPLILIFVIFYFILIRPQTKKQKEHQEMIDSLEVGNEVVTAGGILGKIREMNEQYVQLEISENVNIKIQRQTISSLLPKGTIRKG
jgi:preprotein translocase subunit YajC|tara:strand:- start:141 stop:464 length:324 start_codon:yes stop_codon:yes gene_type:complete